MLKTKLICLLFLFAQGLFGQLSFDFNSGDLSAWTGDINNFVINQDGQLQLMAPDAGSSNIFSSTSFPDSLFWEMDVNLNFSPSGSNRLTIYLALTSQDISSASGYYLEIGESGSQDAIHFYYLEQGSENLLASGIMGNVASAFNFKIKLSKGANDNWLLQTTNLDNQSSQEEFFVVFNDNTLSQATLFGLGCDYTSSRREGFIFDNIVINEIQPDLEAPVANNVLILNPSTIEIQFNEALDQSSIENLTNYAFSTGNSVSSASLDPLAMNTVTLNLDSPLPSGQQITFTVSGISDNVGNVMSSQEFIIALEERPDPGDLLVNEILFDPYTGGEDFIELVNNSDKFLQLEGLIILNADKSEEKIITQNILLLPNEIVAFSEDINFLFDQYQPPADAHILLNDLPSFNNSDGNVSIVFDNAGDRIIIDSFDYEEDCHFSLLRDTEGVSLERISVIGETQNKSNWFSASETVNFATPGYLNSNRVQPQESDDAVNLEYKVFSPDQDGNKDFLIINYNLDKSGYVGNISVYDDYGRLERRLVSNELVSSTGFINWDGTLADGRIGPVGMYIIQYEFFHSDGTVVSGKEVCVLAPVVSKTK